ncbi:MAG: ABC transporter ATP-binding protein [Planctomycetota bacterium]|jgi:ABC-type polysaccharide/polyol phosphate transport system ATPase subunit
MSVIEVKDLGVKFWLRRMRKRSMRHFLLHLGRDGRRNRELWALRNVSFGVEKGEILGVVGPNGAGKTTLLRVLAGIYQPDEGSVRVDGRISPLLALGTGFRPDLTGRDNIYLNGMFLGLRKSDIDARIDEIISFSELGDFIDQPLRSYSAGMGSRLGFSIAVSMDPDILLIDEILSVGDYKFTSKAYAKMQDMMKQAKAIVYATHSLDLVTEFCTRAVWLDRGKVKGYGPSKEVVNTYIKSTQG